MGMEDTCSTHFDSHSRRHCRLASFNTAKLTPLRTIPAVNKSSNKMLSYRRETVLQGAL